MKLVAIIPARLGSKRIPQKNTRFFHKKRLIEWAVEVGLRSDQINHVWITTNDPQILKMDFRNKVSLWRRSSRLSKDNSLMVDVVIDLLRSPEVARHKFTHFILLQPTSPKRTVRHVDEAIHLFKSQSCNSLFSVKEAKEHSFKQLLIEKGRLVPAVSVKHLNSNSQQLPRAVSQNGAIYIAKISSFMKIKSFYVPKCIPYLMSEADSLDIDTWDDLKES